MCLLLQAAHDDQDWAQLGLSGFARYVEVEIGISRAHAYRLLDQARVITELARAAEIEPAAVALGQRVAQRIRRDLPAVTARVRSRTSSSPTDARAAIVCEVAHEEAVSRAGDTRPSPSHARAAKALVDLERGLRTPTQLPSLLAGAIASQLGDDSAAHERWADYLADAAAALRHAGGDPTAELRQSPRPARRVRTSRRGDQLTLWDSAEETPVEVQR
jgi:hypothetical protein